MYTTSKLTHFDHKGNAHMVDVGEKPVSQRQAVAGGSIRMQPETLHMIESGSHKKGDVLAVARIAAIMAAKKTADLIPLCHPLMLTKIQVDLTTNRETCSVDCQATVEVYERTGVEMEALMAVQVALLTVYDMCKAVDRGMLIEQVGLHSKSGGHSGNWQREVNDD